MRPSLVKEVSGRHVPVESLKGSLLDLPNEILSHILELGYFEYGGDPPNDTFLALVSKLSHKFRELVLETPSLWSVVQLSFTNVFPELEFLSTRLQRSMMYPLTLRLSCYWDQLTTEEVIDKLLPHIERWTHFSVTITNSHLLTLLEHQPAPFLEYLSISFYAHENHVSAPPHLFAGHLPRLKHLCLRHVDIDGLTFSLRGLQTLEIRGYGVWPSYARLCEMLGGTSNLHELILHVSPWRTLSHIYPGQSLDGPLPQILLPELRRLTINTSEWLSPSTAALIRVFACPKLDFLFVNGTGEPQSIMVYARDVASMLHVNTDQNQLCRIIPRPMPQRFPNHLFLHTCNFYIGCHALPPANLTTLELHRVHWPTYAKLKDMFASLKNLVNLFIHDLNPKHAILNILGTSDGEGQQQLFISDLAEMHGCITLPSLARLTIEFNCTEWLSQDSTKFYTAGLFRIFSMPALQSLRLANFIDHAQWRAIMESLSLRPQSFAGPTSLTLANMTDIIPAHMDDPAWVDIATPLSRLRSLTLNGFGSSNALLLQLLPIPLALGMVSPNSQGPCPLPELEALSIAGDAYVSKPLLHRVISERQAAGKPLHKLCVDRHFASNLESLKWIKERVNEVEVRDEVPISI